MEPIIAKINPGDTGPHVANLQDVLLRLLEGQIGQLQKLSRGLQKERSRSFFGEITREVVEYFLYARTTKIPAARSVSASHRSAAGSENMIPETIVPTCDGPAGQFGVH